MATVQVTVTNGQISAPGKSDVLEMKGKGRAVQIQWVLDSSDWTFPQDGITISGNAGQFTQLGPIAQGARYQCVDANSDSTRYQYTIKLVNAKNPNQTITLDPYIKNDPSNL